MSATKPGILTLVLDTMIYRGWTEVRVTRALDRCAADFEISVSDRWQSDGPSAQPWQISPGDACIIAIDGTAVLTGWVDTYQPSIAADSHTVRIAGRSKTCDLVDCALNLKGSSFSGYKLDSLARAVAAPFSVNVVVQTDLGAAFPTALMQKNETAFQFLERYARMRSVILIDDGSGALVITNTGNTVAPGALVQGVNVLHASGTLSFAHRFSSYTIFSQLGSDGSSDVQCDVIGMASDPAVTRFRPSSKFAESEVDIGGAQKRATWEMLVAAGKSVTATVIVPGWYQPDGSLWQVNQLVTVNIAMLKLNRQMLVASVRFTLDDNDGHRTELIVGPPEAFTPEPVKPKSQKGSSKSWADVQVPTGMAKSWDNVQV